MNETRKWPLFKEQIDTAEGTNTTEFHLTVNHDGSMRIDGCYSGPSAKAFWGDWDHEFWINIPPSHMPALLALALCDAFMREGRLTYAKFLDLLRQAEIPFNESHW